MDTYELYSDSRYGVSGYTYWEHLLALAPPDLRKDISDTTATADGLVFASAVSALAVPANVLYLLYLWYSGTTGVGGAIGSVLMAIVMAAAAYVMSLGMHRELGKQVRAAVDLAVGQLPALLIGDGAGTEDLDQLQNYLLYLRRPKTWRLRRLALRHEASAISSAPLLAEASQDIAEVP